MCKELKIVKYLTPNEYLEVEKKRFLAGYPNFKVNWNAFPNPEPVAMTTVLEMMKKDTQSVVGLPIEYDYGGTKPIIDVISDGRVSEYNYTIEDEPKVGKIYQISFASSPMSYYCVYANNVKILLTGVE